MSGRRRQVLSLGLLLLIVWSAVPSSSASARVLSLSDYQQILQESVTSLRNDPTKAPDVAQRLNAITAVEMPNQSTSDVDLRTIVANLQSAPPRVDDAITSLSTILALLDRSTATAMSQERLDLANASLAAILARSEFQPGTAKSHSGIFSWIGGHVRAIAGPIVGPIARALGRSLGGLAPWRTIGVIALVVIGILAAVTVVVAPVRGFRRLFGPRIARYAGEPSPTVVTAAELRREADELARESSYRQAIRTLYLAALVRLDERGLLRFERALTNREVLRSAASHDGLALSSRLAPLVDRIDRYWYGTEICTEQEYREFARLSEWAWEGA